MKKQTKNNDGKNQRIVTIPAELWEGVLMCAERDRILPDIWINRVILSALSRSFFPGSVIK